MEIEFLEIWILYKSIQCEINAFNICQENWYSSWVKLVSSKTFQLP